MRNNTATQKIWFKTIVHFICFLAFGVLTNCSNHNDKINSKLTYAEAMVEEHPDSVLVMLDSISLPEINDIETEYRYKLLKVEAKYKAFKDINKDTAIFKIKDYYVKNKNFEEAARAALYCGLILSENKDKGLAIHSLLEAAELAKSTDNTKLKGYIQYSIAKITSNMLLCEKAIPLFKNALEYFIESESYRYQIATFTNLGNNYAILSKKDSALISYKQGLELAKLHKDSAQELQIKINMSVAYSETGDNNTARLYLRQALIQTKDSVNLGRTYLNLARTFTNENRDSTLFYAGKSLGFSQTKKQKKTTILSAYSLLSQTEAKAGNYQEAFNYRNKYLEKVTEYYEDREQSIVLEGERKYNVQVLKNLNKQLVIEQQWFIVIILLLLLVLIVIVLVAYKYYRKHKLEREEIELEKLETEQKIEELQKSANCYNAEQNKNTTRNLLLQQFNIMKKVALFDGYLRDEDREHGEKVIRKFNEIIYGKETVEWEVLYQSMNELEGGIFDRIKTEFPLLDEIEFRICCLTCAQLSNTEIGIILKLSTNTIHGRKTIIRRKIKLGSYGNLEDFIRSKITKA